jgi:uncharacterized protein (UPF0335 family)
MRRATFGLVALVLLSSLAAAAPGIRWAGSYEEALEEAKERGVLILCVLVMPNEASNDTQMAAYQDRDVIQACGKFVCLLGNHGKHREVKRRVDGKMKTVCPVMGNHPCRVHQAIEKIIVRKFGEVMIDDTTGNVRTPVQWVIDGDEKIVEVIAAGDRTSGFGPVAPADLASRLLALAAKRPGLTAEGYLKIQTALAEGDRLFGEKKYAEAAARYQGVLAQAPAKSAAAARANAQLAKITEIGEKYLVDVERLAGERKYAEAMAKANEVIRQFRGSGAETKARKVLADLRKNPEVARLLEQSQRKKDAEALLARARSEEKRKRWHKAAEAYEQCAGEYGDTEAGQAAKKRLEEIRADESIQEAIREAAAATDCRKWLNLAKNFINNNLHDRAKVYLRKVLDQYPGTSYAKEAQKLLDGLK